MWTHQRCQLFLLTGKTMIKRGIGKLLKLSTLIKLIKQKNINTKNANGKTIKILKYKKLRVKLQLNKVKTEKVRKMIMKTPRNVLKLDKRATLRTNKTRNQSNHVPLTHFSARIATTIST